MKNLNKNTFFSGNFDSSKFYKLILAYVIIAVSWVVFFDTLLPFILKDDVALIRRINILDDWAFVAITGLCFYYFVRALKDSNKEMQKDFQLEKEKLSLLFEQMPVGFSLTIYDSGTYLLVNKHFLAIAGFSKEEVIGKTSTELKLWSGTDRKRLIDNLSKGNKVTDYEGFFRIKNGNNINVLMSSEIIDYDGKKCILSLMSDITERRITELRINESEEQYRTLVESMQDGLFLIMDYKFIFVNGSFAKYLGYAVEEIIGTEFHRYVYQGDLNFVQEIYRERISSEKPEATYELRIVDKNKNSLICEIKIGTIKYKDGFAILGSAKDITEKRKTQEALIESEARYKELMDFLPHTIFDVELDGTFIFANKFGINLFGFEEEEFYSRKRKIFEYIIKEDVERAKIGLKKMLAEGTGKAVEYTAQSKSGQTFPILISAVPIFKDKVIKGIRGYLIDITEKKKEEEKLIRAKEKAEESDRLKSNFLAQISHEIRTPLNIILGYNSYLKNELKDEVSGDIIPIFDSIYNAGRRLFRTIDAILNMSMLRAGKVEAKLKDVDIAKLVTSILKEMQHFAGSKNINLTFHNECGNCKVKSDDYILNQILLNLIDNAIKYTSKGYVEVSISFVDERKCIKIKDTGIGISDTFKNELFKPFTQAEMGYGRNFEGNGLGLALVKNYSDILNAELSVESELGFGSVFSIILPN